MCLPALESLVDCLKRTDVDPLFSCETTKQELVKATVVLERYLGFRLFDDPENPSLSTLSSDGKTFWPCAVEVIRVFRSGLMDVYNSRSSGGKSVIVNTSLSVGRNIIVPALSDAFLDKSMIETDVEVLAYEERSGEARGQAHILARPLCSYDLEFFDLHWSYVAKQGLFASGDYLRDVGVPTFPKDLQNHAILGCASSFYDGTVWDENWHLSGKYGLPVLKAAIIMNCKTVFPSAAAANLGIGPISDDCDLPPSLIRVLPEIFGPELKVGFAVRKGIPDSLRHQVQIFENYVLQRVNQKGLEVIVD